MKRILIPIQSISDIITNSSSETFCVITSENDKLLDNIHQILSPFFFSETYSEDEITLDIVYKEDGWEDGWEDEKDLPDRWLAISIPYGISNIDCLLRVALDAILSKQFPDGGYRIEYV